MKKLLLLAVVAAVLFYLNRGPAPAPRSVDPSEVAAAPTHPAAGGETTTDDFSDQQSGAQVTGEGQVSRILGDDSIGDRHQRFILRLPSGQTVLIAHNIDIAPRIEGLNVGDTVSFHGEFEWNDKGGVVHWTHHDPQGSHESGWLKHAGRTYQ